MKIFICLVFFVGFCFCVDHTLSPSEKHGREINVNYGVYDDKKYGAEDKDSIIRPCGLQDIDCISKFFAANSYCSPIKGPIPDPYHLKYLSLDIPQANLTFLMDIVQIKGLNEWKIEEFYINRATGNLVLEVVFERIVTITPNATIRFYRKGKEPVEISDYDVIEYDNVSLTLTIPNIKGSIQPSKGYVYTYLPNAAPRYTLGPRFFRSKGPDETLAFAVFIENVALNIREVYVTQGPLIMSIFLRSTICDFGDNLRV